MTMRTFNPSMHSAARTLLCLATVLLPAMAVNATAQGIPKYVVSSQTTIATNLSGAVQNYATNSRGDLFFNAGIDSTGAMHVYEYPASGAAPFVIFTEPIGNTYGNSGLAVDYQDNLYVTNFFGPATASGSSIQDGDTQIYEFPYTNGTYPAPYIYNPTAAPGSCSPAEPAMPATNTSGATSATPANTAVCAYGQYVSATQYYWQPLGFAVDGSQTSYMIANYANVGGNQGAIFGCNLFCGEQVVGGNAYVLVGGASPNTLPQKANSIAADYAGDVFYTDGVDLNEVLSDGMGGHAALQTIIDATYNDPVGVSIDRAGNLYVTDNSGVWEVPLVNGKLAITSKFLILSIAPDLYGAQPATTVDNKGNVYFNSAYNNLVKASLFSNTFPATAVAATTAAQTFSIVFNGNTVITSLAALQGTTAATEFAVTPGTCVGTFNVGTTCTFSVAFTPSAVGIRTGSVVITDNTGATTTTNLTGVGEGAAVTVDPGTPTQVGSGLKAPSGLAVDKSGNVFVADPTANAVYEFPGGGTTAVTVATGLNVPTGVAVDSGGNVFIVNQGAAQSTATASTGTVSVTTAATGSIVEVANVGGTFAAAPTTVLAPLPAGYACSSASCANGLNMPTDIVLDGTGNIFVSNTASNNILQISSQARYGTDSASITIGTGLLAPTGLAIDSSANLYVADTGNNRVVQIGDDTQTVVTSGLDAPTGVAVEPSGAVIIADQGTGRLVRIPFEGVNGLAAADETVLDSPLADPYGLRLDGTGNLYVSDNQAALVYQLQRTTGTVDFGNYNLNTTGGPNSIIVSSLGNVPLTLGSPLYPAVPAASGFTVNTGATLGCTGTVLAAGENCTLDATFTPTITGPVTYPLVIAASGLNTGTPTVNLVGSGVSLATATIALTQTPTGALSYGEAFSISATLTGTTGTPTGTIVFTLDGQAQRPASLAAGVASITFNGINAGTHSIQARYSGDATFAAVESPVLPLIIQTASTAITLTVSGDSAQPLSVAPANPIGLTVKLVPATPGLFQGTITFMLNGQIVPGTIPTSVGSADATGAYTVSANVMLPLGVYTFDAVYSGNANYVGGTSNSQTITVIDSTFSVGFSSGSSTATVFGTNQYTGTTTTTAGTTTTTYALTPPPTPTPFNATITATASAPAIVNMVITSYSKEQGGVDLACSGLPANAYCVFRPAIAALQVETGTTPTTIVPIAGTLQINVDEDPGSAGSATSSFGWIGAVLAAILLFFSRKRLRNRGLVLSTFFVMIGFGVMASLSGCGSGTSSAFPTPAGSYPVVVTATETPNPASIVNPPTTANLIGQISLTLVVK